MFTWILLTSTTYSLFELKWIKLNFPVGRKGRINVIKIHLHLQKTARLLTEQYCRESRYSGRAAAWHMCKCRWWWWRQQSSVATSSIFTSAHKFMTMMFSCSVGSVGIVFKPTVFYTLWPFCVSAELFKKRWSTNYATALMHFLFPRANASALKDSAHRQAFLSPVRAADVHEIKASKSPALTAIMLAFILIDDLSFCALESAFTSFWWPYRKIHIALLRASDSTSHHRDRTLVIELSERLGL